MLYSLDKYRLPVPVDHSICEGWLGGLDIPKDGDTVLYTSCLYQLVPYINEMTRLMERLGEGSLAQLLEGFHRLVAVAGRYLIRPLQSEVDRTYGIVRRIALMLKDSGVQFAYIPNEPYSGALLYELGYVDDFKRYFTDVVLKFFEDNGVKRVITIDPHTHNILVNVAPRLVGELPFEVINYMNLIKVNRSSGKLRVVIHDSCIYSRYFNMRDVYRRLLDEAGIEHVEDPYITGVATSMCCGGPIESIKPSLSNTIAKMRIESLAKLSDIVVVECPICLANLSRNSGGKVKVVDLAEVLKQE